MMEQMASKQPGTETKTRIAILAHDVWRIYHTDAQEVPALRGVSFNVQEGEFVAIKGRSGSGKTTLMNCIGGLDTPNRGEITIFGENLLAKDQEALTTWRRDHVGFVFQTFGLMPTLSAYENVELMLRIAGAPADERHNRSSACLELVGLGKWMKHRPYEMSGGQQQRVAIARSLANHPQLILADEPTGELDSSTAREILGLFRQVVEEEGVTVMMVSHDALVDEYADRLLQLQDGQVLTV